MRALFLAVSFLVLVGCATKQETAELNAALYNQCVSAARTDGEDPLQKCGRNIGKYRASFGDKNDYFPNQYRAQQEQRTGLESTDPGAQYRRCYSAVLTQPTRTGSLAEAISNAELVCSGMMPYSATKPAPVRTTDCRPDGVGGFSCTTQ